MPHVIIKTGFTAPDGHEEKLTEYFCDWPGCSNVATEVLGRVREIGACTMVCKEHAGARSA